MSVRMAAAFAVTCFVVCALFAGCKRRPPVDQQDRTATTETEIETETETETAEKTETETETAEKTEAETRSSEPAGRGTIVGRVVYRGTLPETTKMYVPEAGTLEAHTIIVDRATGGLKNAAVWVEGIIPRTPGGKLAPATLDQSDWTFVPHVLVLQTGQSITVLNSDVANHNVHSKAAGNEFNVASIPGVAVRQRFRKATGNQPVRLQCDIHDWMRAWVYVLETEAFAVTDKQGAFRISDVPAGEQQLTVHHADGGLEGSITVRVAANEEVEVTIEVRQGQARGSPR